MTLSAPLVATLLVAAASAQTAQPCGDPKAGPVLGGIDLVALYNDPTSKPVNGSVKLSDSALGGYTFLFASQENLAAFQANRSKYTPGFGGY